MTESETQNLIDNYINVDQKAKQAFELMFNKFKEMHMVIDNTYKRYRFLERNGYAWNGIEWIKC